GFKTVGEDAVHAQETEFSLVDIGNIALRYGAIVVNGGAGQALHLTPAQPPQGSREALQGGAIGTPLLSPVACAPPPRLFLDQIEDLPVIGEVKGESDGEPAQFRGQVETVA